MAAIKFRKLDAAIRDQIARKLRSIVADPGRHLTRLRSVGAHRLRVGDYRLIVDVDWKGEVLYVLTLGHRSTVHR